MSLFFGPLAYSNLRGKRDMASRTIYKQIPPHRISILHSRAARNIVEFRENILRDYSLTSPEWFVLGYAASATASGGVRVGDIAAELDVQSTYVTGTLRKLEAKELIKLEAGPSDRRVRLITVTKKGGAVFRAVETEFVKKSDSLIGETTEVALKNYLHVLEAIAKQTS
jgi:DNA-binding MarR family transcriptional regulator